MKTKTTIALILAGAAVVAAVVLLRVRPVRPEPQPTDLTSSATTPDAPPATIPESVPTPPPVAVTENPAAAPVPPQPSAASTNKLERLAQIRETFRKLAAGDRTTAIRAAKQITDELERETALVTLATEWTHGELRPLRYRADILAEYGLEAGLGVELAKDPELAMLWANELTKGRGRAAVLQAIAGVMVTTDPASAIAVSQQLPENDRPRFINALFADWAAKDTEAALQWVQQFPEADREALLQAIRSVAPVGIGASLSVKDGYPVIRELVPGTPAALGGELRTGDRIVGLAQGNYSFVDAKGMSMQEVVKLVRGAPGTMLQLQVLPADAPPGSPPRTISIIRDQVKFKR